MSLTSVTPGVSLSKPEKLMVNKTASPLFEIALVLVRLDHVVSLIINANQGIRLNRFNVLLKA
jgi:hypothetical protein